MAAIFRPRANMAATLILLGIAALTVGGVVWWWEWPRVDWARHVGWHLSSPSLQPPASRRWPGDRLPLLPYHGRNVRERGHAADLYLHDLPFADLDQCGDPGSGAATVWPTTSRSSGIASTICRITSISITHPHRQGRGLCRMSRPDRSDAAAAQGARLHDGLLSSTAMPIPARGCGRKIRSIISHGSAMHRRLRRRL